jgi:hypothetical protein
LLLLAHYFWVTHGNNAAVMFRSTAFSAEVRALAEETSPRRFWSGITAAVHRFRDHHTGAPVSYGAYYGSLRSTLGAENSGALGACFGLTELDLMGGGRGYTVFRSDGMGGVTDVPLKVGDVLVLVDGEPVDAWLERAPGWGIGSPSDPRADPAWLALELPGLLSMRAQNFTVARCESPTSCVMPLTLTVMVGSALKNRMLQTGHLYAAVEPFKCDGRFLNSVSELAPDSQDGSDVVTYEPQGGTAAFQFDGFSGGEEWTSSFSAGLNSSPARILLDARLGNGGTADLAQFLMSQIRDSSSPQLAFGISRKWEGIPGEWDFQEMLPCIETEAEMLFDACSGTITFMTVEEPAVGGSSRVAWVNSADVSANDYVPRFLKGRPGVRIFGPHETSGAYGAVVSLPPLLPGEAYGGSIQIHDTRFATSLEDVEVARPFESGTGVTPDEVVVQKLSDALVGTDTMITRARAWLAETP